MKGDKYPLSNLLIFFEINFFKFSKMNNQEIQINNFDYKNRHFTKAKYFGYEILINDEDKYINITKLLNMINEEHRKNNKRLKQYYDYKQTEDYKEYFEFLNKKLNTQNSGCSNLEYKIKGNQYMSITGTYIHPKLLNCVLMWADKKYAFYVSEIMEQLNNNDINKVNESVEKLKTNNEQLQQENQKLKNEINEDKPKLIPVQSNELNTNVKIKVYENLNDSGKTYKISYDQRKYLDKTEYKLIKEYQTNSASNITKSNGLKQYYIDKKTRVFKSDNLNDVINYLNNTK